MLCSACLRIFDDSPKIPSSANTFGRTRLWMHHSYPYLIELASQDGCQICCLLWDKFSQLEKVRLRATASVLHSSPILPSFPPVAAVLGHLSLMNRTRLLPTLAACCFFDIVLRPLWRTVSANMQLPKFLLSASEPFRLLYTTWRSFFRGMDDEFYGWQVDLAEAEYSYLTLAFPFAVLNWNAIPLTLLLAHDARTATPVQQPDGSEMVFHLRDCIAQNPVSPEMDSADNWDLIRRWNSRCRKDDQLHPLCHPPRNSTASKPPTRLIDLAAGPEGHDLQLVSTETLPVNLEYVTLSYCWGIGITEQEALPLLREATLQPYRQQIPMDDLPLLFQDAIQVTRKMEMRYLWIDALCIIQDNEGDKRTEIMNMGDIYMGATLNIAAGGAPNVMSPLICNRNTSFVEPIRVEIVWNNLAKRQRYRSSGKPFQGSHIVIDGNFVPANLQDSPLGRRAWVMQEQTLSNRILHFGKHQLFWQCRAGHACETFPRGMPGFGPFLGYSGVAFGLLTTEFARNIAQIDMATQWWLMVELYSRRDVLRVTDRLPAVSALTRLFAERAFRNDNFVGGMWLSQLPFSLCWGLYSGAAASTKQDSRLRFEGVAPSWSWASVDSHITPPLRREFFEYNAIDIWPFPLIDLQDVDVRYLNPQNPYGECEAGLLKISCSLILSADIYWVNKKAMGWKNPDKQQHSYGAAIDRWLGPVAMPSIFFSSQFDLPDREEASAQKTIVKGICKYPSVHLLPIREWRKGPEEYSPDGFTEGIVVRQLENGHYRRIGHWRTILNTHDSVFDRATHFEELVLE